VINHEIHELHKRGARRGRMAGLVERGQPCPHVRGVAEWSRGLGGPRSLDTDTFRVISCISCFHPPTTL
jgi:hypothetical protein